MFRYSLATLVSAALGLTGYAQSNAPRELPGLLTNNPGTVVSNSVPLPNSAKAESVLPVGAKVSGPIDPVKELKDNPVVPVNLTVPQTILGHTTTCADSSACQTCPPSHGQRGCMGSLKSLFGYKPANMPCECGPCVSPYRPPLYTYFVCKGAPFTLAQPGCSTGCSTGCASGVCAAPVAVHPAATTPSTKVIPAPTTPNTVPPMSPTISSSYKGGPNATTTNVASWSPIQASGYSASSMGTTGTGVKPLSLYSTGGVTTTSMSKAAPSPPVSGDPSGPLIPGYRMLGGTKSEPLSSTSLYPWK